MMIHRETPSSPQKNPYFKTQLSCFITSMATAVTGNLTPLLFLTFRDQYDLSYSLLGLLVVFNFGTQLIFDLVFSFFSHKFNMTVAVKMMPTVMTIGLIVFALLPSAMPGMEFTALIIGTILFSAGAGLAEVLASPTIAAIPSKNSERMMSLLHSGYAWGVVFVVLFSTAFLYIFGTQYWQILTLILTLIPLVATILVIPAPIPPLETASDASGAVSLLGGRAMILCICSIFLGGATECAMSQWCSGYLEMAIGIDKVWGDILGVAVFGAMLGLGRSLYTKFGSHAGRVLTAGAAGAVVCYLTAALSGNSIVGLIACGLTGLCASMLWPGSLIVMADLVPSGGVTIYALMAAGGDLGASFVPQMIGVVTDAVISAPIGAELASKYALTVDQIGMKAGMLFASIFPILAVVINGILTNMQDRKLKEDKQHA